MSSGGRDGHSFRRPGNVYVFFFITHARRRIVHFNVTAQAGIRVHPLRSLSSGDVAFS